MKFQLGEWTVDEDANLLARDGGDIRVERRVMAVLMELVKAKGGVVAKEALIEAVWNGAVISDHSVANAVSDLRRALGDDRREPRYVETVPKRGYRLIAKARPIEIDDDSAAAAPVRRPAVLFGAALIGAIAILGATLTFFLRPAETNPRLFLTEIENATGDEHFDIDAATAGEMLTVALAGGDYRLIRWRASPDDQAIPARARDRLLGGRIILDSGAPVLALELIDEADGASVWAGAYPLGASHYGALTASVSADLKSPLGLGAASPAFASADPAILEAYWRARYLWSLREHDAIREARRILTDATNKAPGFAPGHAALADIYAHKTAEELGIDRRTTYDVAEQHLARATELDPHLSEAFVTRAYLAFFRDGDPAAARSHIGEAIALRPENAIAWQTKAMIESAAGEGAASVADIEQARALDPLSAGVLWDRVWFLYIARRFDEALEAAGEARRISAPVDVYEALIHLARSDDEAALKSWLARARERGLSDQQAEEIESLARQEGARAALIALAAKASGEGYMEFPVPLAGLHFALGDKDAAVNALLADGPHEKSWWWSWYQVIPALDGLRDDPRLAVAAGAYLVDHRGKS